MIKSLLSKLGNAFATTASRHKKKLIFVAILIIGFQIARRKIKTQAIVSIVLFFVKFWSKMMQILPLPAYANYRFIESFQFMQQTQIPELATVIDLKRLLIKIKNKEPGALNELKISVFSAVLLNVILYKVDSIYELIKRKYSSDFSQLGAGQIFQQSMSLLKVQYIKNLPNFRIFIASELNSQLQNIDLLQVVNQNKVSSLFTSLIEKLQKQTLNVNQKVLSHKTSAESTKQYKIAQNYFKTTKQYMEPNKNTKLSKIANILFYPVTTLFKGVSSLLKSPEQSLTNHRFTYIQYFYILPLKKFRNNMTWPNLQSKHLFQMVLQELTNFFYSINFSIVSSKRVEYNLRVFMNRIDIYFVKKAKCQSKKLMDLLPIFFKIIQEQIVVLQRRKDFYERQLINAFKDTKYTKIQNIQIGECRLRNRVLQEIYYKNQIEHLERDMQAKLYSERDGLVIEPVAKSSRIYEQKDDIQQLMQIYNRADVQKQTTVEQMQMMREIME